MKRNVVYTRIATGFIQSSIFNSDEEFEQHQLNYPEMYGELYNVVIQDVTQAIEHQIKIASDDEIERLCKKAFQVIKVYNRYSATPQQVYALLTNPAYSALISAFLTGTPSSAKGLFLQLDTSAYPPNIVNEVISYLDQAISKIVQ